MNCWPFLISFISERKEHDMQSFEHKTNHFASDPFANNPFATSTSPTPAEQAHRQVSPHQQTTVAPHTIQPSTPSIAPRPTGSNYYSEAEIHENEKKARTIIKDYQKWSKEDAQAYHKGACWQQLINSQPTSVEATDPPPVDFPFDVFPLDIEFFIKDIEQKHSLSRTSIASLVLGAGSLATRGKFVVKRNDEHTEQTSLYMLTMSESGTKKSPLLKMIFSPIHNYEKACRDSVSGNKNLLYSISKATSSGLEKTMAEQNGILGIVSSEAGILQQIRPQNDNLFLMGYDGEAFRYVKAKENYTIDNPFLTISIFAQEEVVQKFLTNKALQHDGLIGRFLLSKPKSSQSDSPPDELRKEYKDTWHEIISNLLAVERNASPYELLLTSEAGAAWNRFFVYTSRQSRKVKEIAKKSFYRKLAGTTLRIAGILHLLSSEPHSTPIGDATMTNAISIAKFFEDHTCRILSYEKNELLTLCNRATSFLKDRLEMEVPVRAIYRYLHIKRHELNPILKQLEKHNQIAICKYDRTETCLIHPNLRSLS